MVIESVIWVALLMRSAASAVGILIALRWFSQTFERRQHEALYLNKRLIIVISVIEEENLIAATVNWYGRLIQRHKNLEVCVVGSIREKDDAGENQTIKRAELEINRVKLKNVRVFESRNMLESKADQINVFLSERGYSPEAWLLFVDIDSRIDDRSVKELFWAINSDIQVAQMHSVFTLNFSKLSYFQRGQAIYQTRWTFAHEVRRLYFASRVPWHVGHVVGHGLCINSALLSELGGFPTTTDVEDIQLGYNLIASRQKIVSLRSLEIADNPVNVMDGLRQEFSWSFGPLQYFAYRRFFLGKMSRRKVHMRARTWVISCLGFLGYIEWALQGGVILTAVWSIIRGSPLALCFFVSYLFEHLLVIHFLCRKGYLESLTIGYMSLPAVVVEWIRRSIPAVLAGLYYITAGKGKRIKTVHSDV